MRKQLRCGIRVSEGEIILNYKDLLLNTLSDDNIDLESGIPSLNKPLLDFTKNYLELRFSNNLKQYNYDESKAYDLFSAKKAMEYLNIYVEEFFFLARDKNDGNYYERKFFRQLIHLLNLTISEVGYDK